MKKEYEIVITYKCNWRCEYCCVDTHARAEVSRDTVFSKIKKIEDGNNVTISGGEPGMLSAEYLEEVLQLLTQKNCDIGLNTNGLFLEKHKGLLKYISNVNYHCSENLDIAVPILNLSDISSATKIDYQLVVHDKNEHKLEAFLNHYPDITFNVVPGSTSALGIADSPVLTDKYSILTRFHNRITIESKKGLLKEKIIPEIIYL